MTKNTDTTETKTPNGCEPKTSPFEGMAETMREILPPEIDTPDAQWHAADPVSLIQRQMGVLDKVFTDTATRYRDAIGVRYGNPLQYVPLLLTLNRNCLEAARTLTTIDYLDTLNNNVTLKNQAQRKKNLTRPPPPKIDKQTNGYPSPLLFRQTN